MARLEGKLPITAAFSETGISVIRLKDAAFALRKKIRDNVMFGQSTVLKKVMHKEEIALTLPQRKKSFTAGKGKA